MSDTRANVCPCGRSFAKAFGMRVHGRTCPIERARSEAFVKAVQEGRSQDIDRDCARAIREALAQRAEEEGGDVTASVRELQVAALAMNDPEVVELRVEITIDPAAWVKEYGGAPDFASVERAALAYVRNRVEAMGPFASVMVKAI